MERFAALLDELGEELNIGLYPDQKGACLLLIDDHFRIQLECHVKPDHLLVASFLCDIPPGKFRETVLKDALKANLNSCQEGILAYSERNNQLTLFSFLPLSSLNGKVLAHFLTSFLEKGDNWIKAVRSGDTSRLALEGSPSTSPGGGIFGLQH